MLTDNLINFTIIFVIIAPFAILFIISLIFLRRKKDDQNLEKKFSPADIRTYQQNSFNRRKRVYQNQGGEELREKYIRNFNSSKSRYGL